MPKLSLKRFVPVCLVGLGLLSSASLSRDSAAPAALGSGANWEFHGGDDEETGYSRLDQISTGTISRLGLAWSLDLEGEQTLEATPLAIDGKLYFTGTWGVIYAVDALSGKLLWKHDPEVWKHGPAKLRFNLAVNRGVAFADGRIFSATMDGRLLALDAKTGKELWSVLTVKPDSVQTITGAPRVFKGKVIIGHAGGDYGVRGYVTAYDQATGSQAWRFYTVPGAPEENKGDPAMERAAATWTGEYWKTGTGGTVWNGITFDPELNQVYLGTGNSGPYDPRVRSPGGGDNLYLVSIVALNADTGKYVWHYQMNPREAWDYKSTPNMISATLTIDGRPRKILMQAHVNGFFYVLDRVTGQLISAEKFGKATWAERIDLKTGRPVEAPNIRYETGATLMSPGPTGAHNWQAMSFSPQTGLAYIPYMQNSLRYSKVNPGPGVVSFGGLAMAAVEDDPADGKGALVAWDPVTQKARWKVQHEWIWNGGTMATAGGLVFQGTADGYFTAYDAATGKPLWRFNAGLGIIAPPISYSVGGKQYVSILVGWGSSNMLGGRSINVGWKYNAQPRRLLTFALDGKAKLPPTAPPSREITPFDDPSIAIAEADIEPGRVLFTVNCSTCHGLDGVSAGAPAPDLRESQMAADRATLWQILHEGALLERGMPQFQELDATQVKQIHAFMRATVREALGTRPKTKSSESTGVR